MKNIVITVFAIICISACSNKTVNNQAVAEGVIELNLETYQKVEDVFLKPDMVFRQKIWYQDSFAIEEVCSLNTNTDENNITTSTIDVVNYRFNDLKKQTIYVYRNFKDTAKYLQKYSFNDTSVKVIGGWGFNFKRGFDYIGKPYQLRDTVVNNINFKRYRLSREGSKIPYYSIVYFQCNRNNSLLDLDPNLSEKVGCKCVKVFSYVPNKPEPPVLTEINFIRDKLTTNEKEVFRAWIKNAR